jgi:hypothetical protein
MEYPESHVLARFDAPAFVRRARDLEETWQAIVATCRTRYEADLLIPKLRLATVFALAGDWSRISSFLDDPESIDDLRSLHELWKPRLRAAVKVAPSDQLVVSSLQQLVASFERFNRRWSRFVEQISLTRLNELREAYNRFYLLEKECAMRSPAVARDRFESLPPVSYSDILALFPLLPVPRLS